MLSVILFCFPGGDGGGEGGWGKGICLNKNVSLAFFSLTTQVQLTWLQYS